ncbi:CPBP family glutamic-type intramembrane protease [Methanobrevibacter sp.]
MFNLKEKFEFLEDGEDFPFYNNIPKLSNGDWLILAIGVILFLIIVNMPDSLPKYRPYLYFLVTVIPALYVCKGNYSIFFKKLKARDFKTIILCFIAYILYSIIILIILNHLGVPAHSDAALVARNKLIYLVGLAFQLLGEEFFKISVLLILMYIIFKYSNDRNLTITISIIGTLIIFGLAHMNSYGNLLQVLLLQGLGSIFNLYAYMKTKNVIVSYIIHLMIDLLASL